MGWVMPIPSAVEIVLSYEERAVLESWAARRKTAQGVALRARIVLVDVLPVVMGPLEPRSTGRRRA